MSDDLTLIVCGAAEKRCKCECGHGGKPGDCEHDFKGPMVAVFVGMFSTVCKHCGMSAYSHTMLLDF